MLVSGGSSSSSGRGLPRSRPPWPLAFGHKTRRIKAVVALSLVEVNCSRSGACLLRWWTRDEGRDVGGEPWEGIETVDIFAFDFEAGGRRRPESPGISNQGMPRHMSAQSWIIHGHRQKQSSCSLPPMRRTSVSQSLERRLSQC